MSNMLVGMWNVEVFECEEEKYMPCKGKSWIVHPVKLNEITGNLDGMENGEKVVIEHLG